MGVEESEASAQLMDVGCRPTLGAVLTSVESQQLQTVLESTKIPDNLMQTLELLKKELVVTALQLKLGKELRQVQRFGGLNIRQQQTPQMKTGESGTRDSIASRTAATVILKSWLPTSFHASRPRTRGKSGRYKRVGQAAWMEAWSISAATCIQTAPQTALKVVKYQNIICQLFTAYATAAALNNSKFEAGLPPHQQALLHHLALPQQVVPTTWSAIREQSAILFTSAGSHAVVENTPAKPAHALHQWPHELTRFYDTHTSSTNCTFTRTRH
eukprot:Em0021g998a